MEYYGAVEKNEADVYSLYDMLNKKLNSRISAGRISSYTCEEKNQATHFSAYDNTHANAQGKV